MQWRIKVRCFASNLLWLLFLQYCLHKPTDLTGQHYACHLLARWFPEPISSTLKTEAIRSSETSVETQRTTRRHIPEDNTLQNQRCENLKSYEGHSSFQHDKSRFHLHHCRIRVECSAISITQSRIFAIGFSPIWLNEGWLMWETLRRWQGYHCGRQESSLGGSRQLDWEGDACFGSNHGENAFEMAVGIYVQTYI
jgi:hypothetical protein